MAERENKPVPTMTVLSSKAVADAGRTALVFYFAEAGPVAFEIDLKGIEVLKGNIADLERHLRKSVPKPGQPH